MRDHTDIKTAAPPRAIGTLHIGAKITVGATELSNLYQNGCLRALFPRRQDHLEAVIINTAGGITGGDRLKVAASARDGARLAVTTQASERIYRAQPDSFGRLTTQLKVENDSVLHWLPQETIFYDRGSLDRRLSIDLAPTARALIVEPVLFGRLAMGETQLSGMFRDQIDMKVAGKLIYRDASVLHGDITSQLERPAVAAGMRAMAAVLYRAPDAAAYISKVRSYLNATSGCSLLGADLCVLRLLAVDGFALRQMMLPILDLFTQNTLPKCWRL